MAEKVEVQLTGDEADLKAALEAVQKEFANLAKSSKTTKNKLKRDTAEVNTALEKETTIVDALRASFIRMGRAAVNIQRAIARATGITNAALVAQKGIISRKTPVTTGQQQKAANTIQKEKSLFQDGSFLPTRKAQPGTLKTNVNPEGNISQRALLAERTKAQQRSVASIRKGFSQEQRIIRQGEAETTRLRRESNRRQIADNKAFEKEFLRRRAITARDNAAPAGTQGRGGGVAVAEERKAKATQRATKALRQQSQPLTLLVAKFALMAFAVQTLANIFNSTFGAMLRQIDDFQTAAISTAVAVTGITGSNAGAEAVFVQNLAAARDTFEELELVAARFFSTGQELQLAFNTLAQRGVIVRREEFDTLGKLTDQIKLLTGGQNSQIQIQQELRAILDGNVRTTTAFGKALQARGADVNQLSKEIRATGSIKVFEQFLTGLDAAGGAIRRTLSSVTATFSSLFNILARGIFQDTFDNVVTTITEINNIIIEQKTEIVAIGRFIVSEIAAGWSAVKEVLNEVSGTILRIVQNDLVQFALAILIISKIMKRGPLGVFLGMAGGAAALTGEVSILTDSITILLNLIDTIGAAFDDALNFGSNFFTALSEQASVFIDTLTGKVSGELSGLVDQLQTAETVIKGAVTVLPTIESKLNREQGKGDQADQEEVNRLLDKRTRLQGQIIDGAQRIADVTERIASVEGGTEFLAGRVDTKGPSELAEIISDIAEATTNATIDLGLDGTGTDELDKLIDRLKNLSSEFRVASKESTDFVETIQPAKFDQNLIASQLKVDADARARANKLEDAERKLSFERSVALAKAVGVVRILTGEQVARRLRALRKKENEEQIAATQRRNDEEIVAALSNRNRIQGPIDVRNQENLAAAVRNRGADDPEPSLIDSTTNEERIKVAALDEKIAALRLKSEVEILALRRAGANAETVAITERAEIQRRAQLDIEGRGRTIDAVGGQTNAERVTQINAESQTRQDDFRASGASGAQQAEFNLQEEAIRVQKAVATQINTVTAAIDAAFNTMIDGLVEGSFEFRDLATTLSKDFIKSGLEGLIASIKDTVTGGLTDIFEAMGEGAEDAAAGAKAAAQTLTLAFGFLLAVLSRTGNDGDFEATGGGASGGIDQSAVQTRGLIGGDTQIAIAEINNGLQEALIPTNAILSQIELNTRSLNAGGGSVDLEAIISNQVSNIFQESLLQNA